MASYLGGYTLPYYYPLNYSVQYSACGLISGLGNYATAEVFENGKSVHKHYYPNKDVFNNSYSRALEMSRFLSRRDLDFISRSELDYIYNSEEYEIVASILHMGDSDFRESLRSNILVKHISPYGVRHYQSDSENGLITQIPFGKFSIESVKMIRTSIIELSYTLENSRLRMEKTLHVDESFMKCFLSMVKFNLLLDIVRDKRYWHLSSGSFAADGHTVTPWLDYHDKGYIEELGYLRIE